MLERSTVDAVKPFGPVQVVVVALVTVASIAPVLPRQVVGVLLTTTTLGAARVIAAVWSPPEPMPVAKLSGGLVGRLELDARPKVTTVPSDFSATVWAEPAAIPTMPV